MFSLAMLQNPRSRMHSNRRFGGAILNNNRDSELRCFLFQSIGINWQVGSQINLRQSKSINQVSDRHTTKEYFTIFLSRNTANPLCTFSICDWVSVLSFVFTKKTKGISNRSAITGARFFCPNKCLKRMEKNFCRQSCQQSMHFTIWRILRDHIQR